MDSVSSTIFSSDARFVLTGSDDGNVRIWKAKAADKLGIITARERAAMEYRQSLKERWKMDAQVGKVERYVTALSFFLIFFLIVMGDMVGVDTYRSRCIRLLSLRGLCWKQGGLRRKEGESIRGLGRANPRRSGKRLSSSSRLSIALNW
jgi:hypothetical protein